MFYLGIIIGILLVYNLILFRRHLILLKSLHHESEIIRHAVFEMIGLTSINITSLCTFQQILDNRVSYLESTITCVPWLQEIYKKIIHPKEGGELGQ